MFRWSWLRPSHRCGLPLQQVNLSTCGVCGVWFWEFLISIACQGENSLDINAKIKISHCFCLGIFSFSTMSGQHSKPRLSEPQASELVQRVFSLTPSEVRPLPSYEDQNVYVATAEGGEYVLKIMNSKDSKDANLIEVQTYAMSFLRQNGLPAQTAMPTASGKLMSLEEIGTSSVTLLCPEEKCHLAR